MEALTQNKDLLNVNNAIYYFLKKYCRETKKVLQILPFNQNRYFLVRFEDHRAVFFKFSREFYRKGKKGASDSINLKSVKYLSALHYDGVLDDLFFCYASGDIYTTHINDFLEHSYLEQEKGIEQKQKRIIAIEDLSRWDYER